MTNLAVVIVSWNTKALTLDALHSLYADLEAHGPDSTEVWVIDNASTDGSADAIRTDFPQTKLIASSENLGFAGGNNLALREIGFGGDTPAQELPRAVYLLNSDTRSQVGATSALHDALFELPDAGVVGARLCYGDGSFQHSAFEFPGLMQLWIDLLPTPARLYDHRLNGRYSREQYDSGEPFRVGHTLGATMMLRREVIQQTGMFDEQFYMYCEEIDWSWRIRRAGWQIYCVPAAQVVHLSGQSTQQVQPRSVVDLWTSRLLLFQKYYPRWKIPLAKQIIRWGMRRNLRNLRDDAPAALREAYQTVIRRTRQPL